MTSTLRTVGEYSLIKDNFNNLWCIHNSNMDVLTLWSNDLEELNNLLSLSENEFEQKCESLIETEFK